jgi:hypothetical protein
LKYRFVETLEHTLGEKNEIKRPIGNCRKFLPEPTKPQLFFASFDFLTLTAQFLGNTFKENALFALLNCKQDSLNPQN